MTDLTTLATTDKRVGRELAGAERDRLATEQRIRTEDAAAERRLREKEGQLRLTEQRDQAKANRDERRRKEQQAKRAERRERRQARRQDLADWTQRRVEYVRNNAAAVYSALIYGLAVSGAVYGQVDAARANGLPTPVGVIAAVAIEGTGLAMALTAQQQRLKGERALVARSLIWICTAAAVAINLFGHIHDPVKAIGLSALSALGIIVYEVRSGAKHRKTLRELGVIPEPPERFGWRRWVTYPMETFAAWRIDVRSRLSPGAAALIAHAEARRTEKRRMAAVEVERQRQQKAIEAERERQQKVVAEVAGRARKAATAATKKGDAGAALAALVRLAHTGTPAPLLALPSTAHLEAEAAREELRTVRVALAEAEAEATIRAEAEAEARATADRFRTEAEAAIRRAEAEATHRARAEAEAASANRRAEAEVANAAHARRAEAEARASVDRAWTEAEATRADVMRETERAAKALGQLDGERHEWQGRIRRAEGQTEQVRQELADGQQARHRAETLAEAAKQEASALRDLLAQAAADSPRRPRRTTTKSAASAEPVMFDGEPVPHVDGVGAETVRAILQARKNNPKATQKDIAQQVKVSDRSVRTVLAAVPLAGSASETQD